MRGIFPIRTRAAASSINMNPQTCLPVSAEGEEEGSTWRWEGLQVGNLCLGVGDVSAVVGRVWGRVHWGWKGLLGTGRVQRGRVWWGWEHLSARRALPLLPPPSPA